MLDKKIFFIPALVGIVLYRIENDALRVLVGNDCGTPVAVMVGRVVRQDRDDREAAVRILGKKLGFSVPINSLRPFSCYGPGTPYARLHIGRRDGVVELTHARRVAGEILRTTETFLKVMTLQWPGPPPITGKASRIDGLSFYSLRELAEQRIGLPYEQARIIHDLERQRSRR